MLYGIDRMEKIYKELISSNKTDSELQVLGEKMILTFFEEEFTKRAIPLSVIETVKADIQINAQGLVFAANRAKKKGA